MVISLVHKYIVGVDILSNGQNPHIGFLTYEKKNYYDRSKWKPLIFPPHPWKTVK